jgi:predicted RNase H-like HicB family nuclease
MTIPQPPRYRLALEDMEPAHWIAWALDVPGCYSNAPTLKEAVANAPAAIAAYFGWRSEQDCSFPIPSDTIETRVVETFHAFAARDGSDTIVNGFFEDDRRPLASWEIQNALQVLDWTRRDLDAVIVAMRPEQRSKPDARPAGRETPADLLRHIADAENWYFSHLGLALGTGLLPIDPPERLAAVRANSRAQLRLLAGEARITLAHAEQWSARKIVRRMLWHERDHTQQIARMLKAH